MQLKDYIQGDRHGKEANRLERKAMNDKFLQDALDGFDAVPYDHAQVIERLEKRVAATPATPQNKRNIFFYGSIAASILLLIGFGVYFLSERNGNRNAIVMLQYDESEMEYTTTPSPPVLSEQSEASASKAIEKQRAVNAEKRMLKEQREQTEGVRTQTYLDIVEDKIEVDPVIIEEEEAFEDVLMNEDISYISTNEAISEQAAKQIVVESPIALPVEEQKEVAFSGKIVDEDGEPLIGVNITISGTTIGTLTDINGYFTIHFPENDSSKLIANYIGYETKEIKFSDNNTIALVPDIRLLSEVVVTGYGTRKKAIFETNKRQRRVEQAIESDDIQITFGKKEFQAYCRQKADKNVCDGKKVTVKVSFFIDETGKPTQIKCNGYTCEDAKKEIENLLSSSPLWTTVNKKITMTVKW